MSDVPTILDSIRAALDGAGIELKLRDRQELERALIKGVVARLAVDGYTIDALAVLTGSNASTIRSWRDRDPAFAAQLGIASGTAHKRLRAILWDKAEAELPGTPGVSTALNVLSHLHFPELRSSKVEVETTAAPDAEVAGAKLLNLIRKGDDKSDEI